MFFKNSLAILVTATALTGIINPIFASRAVASTITLSTQFNSDEGFITGSTDPVTISEGILSATFSSGQQQEFFFPPAYNVGPAGFIFNNNPPANTGTVFDTIASTGDAGFIDFNIGVSEVSFFGANLANGLGTTVNVFSVDGELLDSVLISQDNINPALATEDPILTTFSSDDFGGELIGSLEIDLPGPAGNPPYAFSIDTFSATAPVPEPTTIISLLLFGGVGLLSKRQKKA